MRRWQAIPVAAVVACLVGAVLFTSVDRTLFSPPTAHAVATPFELYLDCDPSTGAVDVAPCVFSTGTSTIDIGVVLKNNSGVAYELSGYNFTATTSQQSASFNPTAPACSGAGLDCNPDFNDAGVTGSFSCSGPLPRADFNPSASVAWSDISCSTGAVDGPTMADGATLKLATVHYTSSADGVRSFALSEVNVYNDSFDEMMSCNPVVSTDGTCFDTSVQVGASDATATPVPTDTPTATPTATDTPCSGGSCPTSTSIAYKTVTPTGTPTVPGAATPPPETSPVAGESPAAPDAGGGPTGGAGAGGTRPIRLPDTGSRAPAGTGWTITALLASIALAAGGVAGGAYAAAALVSERRKRGEG